VDPAGGIKVKRRIAPGPGRARVAELLLPQLATGTASNSYHWQVLAGGSASTWGV